MASSLLVTRVSISFLLVTISVVIESICSWILVCSLPVTILTCCFNSCFWEIRVEVVWERVSMEVLVSETVFVVDSIVDSKAVVLDVRLSILLVILVFCEVRSVFFFSMRVVSSLSASTAMVSVYSPVIEISPASKLSSFSCLIS